MATQQCTCFYFEDAPKAVDLLTRAAQLRLCWTKVDGPEVPAAESSDRAITHCEMALGPVVIMLGSVDTGAKPHNLSSLKIGPLLQGWAT